MSQNIINNRMELNIYSDTIQDNLSIINIPSVSVTSGSVFATTVATTGVNYSRVQKADSVFVKRFRFYCDLNAFGVQVHGNTPNNIEFLLKNEAVNDAGDHLKIISRLAMNEWVDVNSILPPSSEVFELDRRIRLNFSGINLIVPSLTSILGPGANISVMMQMEIAHTLPILSL